MLVKVTNKNVHPFKQTVRGISYEFAPGETKEMERDDAFNLLNAYYPAQWDKNRIQRPETYKMLECPDLLKTPGKETVDLVCKACGYKAVNEKDLLTHINSNHLDQMADQELAEEIRSGRPRPKKVKDET